MKQATLDAFTDEMEKISAYMSNVGTRIYHAPRLTRIANRTLAAVQDTFTNPVESMRRGWNRSWAGPGTDTSLWHKMKRYGGNALGAVGMAVPIATALPADDPTGRGESRVSRGVRAVGTTTAGLIGMRRGVVPGMVMGGVGDYAGGVVGRLVDKARGYKPKQKPNVAPEVPTRAALTQQVTQ